MVRSMLTVPKTTFAGVRLEASFARLIALMAAARESERAPLRPLGHWGVGAIRTKVSVVGKGIEQQQVL